MVIMNLFFSTTTPSSKYTVENSYTLVENTDAFFGLVQKLEHFCEQAGLEFEYFGALKRYWNQEQDFVKVTCNPDILSNGIKINEFSNEQNEFIDKMLRTGCWVMVMEES